MIRLIVSDGCWMIYHCQPRMRRDNAFGRVCLRVYLRVRPLTFEDLDL